MNIRRNFNSGGKVNAAGIDHAIQRLQPLLRQRIIAVDDAKNCTDCRRCAVRIFAAINCDAKALFKIILAVQQTQNDDTQIVGSIHTGGAGRQILRQIGLPGWQNRCI